MFKIFLEDVIFTSDDKVDKLVLKLKNKKAGKRNREKFPFIAEKYPDCVVVERFSLQYNIRAKSGDVGSTATVVQFPIKLAFAVTVHKIQGATVPSPNKVVMDIDSTFEAAMCYVMLSRVQQLEQIYILDKFDIKKIKLFPHALKELKRLRSISFNENPTPWFKKKEDSLKVCTLNCAGLKSHFEDIKFDQCLLEADVLQFIETSLLKNSDTSTLQLDGYTSHFLNISKGKGLATYVKNDIVMFDEDCTDNGIQITKFCSNSITLISVYRSQNGNIGSLLELLNNLISGEDAVLIAGDFNLCNNKRPNNAIISFMEKTGFQLLVNEPTQMMGGFIDHAYWRDNESSWETPQFERYSPYFSDHDALCITLLKKVFFFYFIFEVLAYFFRKHKEGFYFKEDFKFLLIINE